jgi:hypothetical protein
LLRQLAFRTDEDDGGRRMQDDGRQFGRRWIVGKRWAVDEEVE